MAVPRIKSTAVLIGTDASGRCVYSEIIDIHDYYDGEHVWDDPVKVKRLRLQNVKGFLFASNGTLDQEFQTTFDTATGEIVASRLRFADGTESRFPNVQSGAVSE
jgi:hypothetical protein